MVFLPHKGEYTDLAKIGTHLKIYCCNVEALYYLCSENNGADQLRGHR